MDNMSEKFSNYYELFGVDSKASHEQIRQAYREKLKMWHPDKNPDRKDEAEEMTKVLNVAYQVLSDPEGRKNYDRMLRFTRGKDLKDHVNDNTFWKKIEKTSPALKRILESVRDLYYLFSDALKGNYPLHPVSIGVIGFGLLYFIMPMDFIPDFIPIAGLLDDVAILAGIINTFQGELIRYRIWKSNKY
jgi:uncharacterized membrane protein YkvA (DUF1232 family)